MDTSKLDRLVAAFEARGIAVASNLRPGASDRELDELAAHLGFAIPTEVRVLYRWRDGHHDPDASNVLLFRDNTFLRLEDIPDAHHYMVSTYAEDPNGDFIDPGVDLATSVPIAAFMGSTYAVACGRQQLTDRSTHPIVGVFHGIDLYFHSVESMIDTCIEWVEQPAYDRYAEAPNEMAIWRRHNPGVF
jgi:hypothetical protein